MTTDNKSRFQTGEKCRQSGTYKFDGYLDGTKFPSPSEEEMRIPLSIGETFPPIRSTGKSCYWKLS